VRAAALGEAATHLPWLSPCADTLVGLARTPEEAWAQVRTDPGAVLLVARQAAASPALPCFPALLLDPAVLEGALAHVRNPGPGFVDWNQPAARPVYHASLTYARLAAALAERTRLCDPDLAWVTGLLAPLGWLAVCAIDGEQAAACLADPNLATDSLATQQRYWGYDQASIARRLARRWQLPGWLAGVVGHLALTAETAAHLGADRDLFLVTQLAVGLAQEQEIGLHLDVAAGPDDIAVSVGLSLEEQQALQAEARVFVDQPPAPPPGRPLHDVPLLADLLQLAAENRRRHGVPALDRLAGELDRLHQALEEQRTSEASRLRAQKLSALAEFAAGAGHEINNPLAVISGQAQYLLSHLQISDLRLQIAECPEPAPVDQSAIFNLKSEIVLRSLQTIVGQAQRIHQMLNELMLFAKPPRPQRQPIDVAGLVREAVAALGERAAERRVQLRCPEPLPSVTVHGDLRQLRTALGCLLRNAVEAAPADGWAEAHIEAPAADRVELVVEDSGSGPARARREHLFDPFYSGREAGRGRGLGLPTAWRLARENGGDVYFDDRSSGPTRFVLRLPLSPSRNGAATENGVHATDNGQHATTCAKRGQDP
jgi:signal transduction histidine kinase